MNLNEFRKSVEYAKDDEIGSNLLTMTYYQINELLALLDQQAAALALAREALEAVEWREVNVWSFCPWCEMGHLIGGLGDSHRNDCRLSC